MPPNSYSHNQRNALQVKVIQSSHCIEVEGLQIELIYMFGQNALHVYIEDKLVLSASIQINRTQVNYANLIEVATTYWLQEEKKRKAREKKEYEEINAPLTDNEKKGLHEYILKDFTTITHEQHDSNY